MGYWIFYIILIIVSVFRLLFRQISFHTTLFIEEMLIALCMLYAQRKRWHKLEMIRIGINDLINLLAFNFFWPYGWYNLFIQIVFLSCSHKYLPGIIRKDEHGHSEEFMSSIMSGLLFNFVLLLLSLMRMYVSIKVQTIVIVTPLTLLMTTLLTLLCESYFLDTFPLHELESLVLSLMGLAGIFLLLQTRYLVTHLNIRDGILLMSSSEALVVFLFVIFIFFISHGRKREAYELERMELKALKAYDIERKENNRFLSSLRHDLDYLQMIQPNLDLKSLLAKIDTHTVEGIGDVRFDNLRRTMKRLSQKQNIHLSFFAKTTKLPITMEHYHQVLEFYQSLVQSHDNIECDVDQLYGYVRILFKVTQGKAISIVDTATLFFDQKEEYGLTVYTFLMKEDAYE